MSTLHMYVGERSAQNRRGEPKTSQMPHGVRRLQHIAERRSERSAAEQNVHSAADHYVANTNQNPLERATTSGLSDPRPTPAERHQNSSQELLRNHQTRSQAVYCLQDTCMKYFLFSKSACQIDDINDELGDKYG